MGDAIPVDSARALIVEMRNVRFAQPGVWLQIGIRPAGGSSATSRSAPTAREGGSARANGDRPDRGSRIGSQDAVKLLEHRWMAMPDDGQSPFLQVRPYFLRHVRQHEIATGLFTPKRSLVRSQYRPPAQTPPPDLGRGRLTTGSDNNAGAWSRASAISYCRGRPLRWSPDQPAAHVVAEGSAGTSRAVAAASGERTFVVCRARSGDSASAGDRSLDRNCARCSVTGRTGPDARQDVSAMTGRDERAQGAGNGGERRGTARTMTLPTISRSNLVSCASGPLKKSSE